MDWVERNLDYYLGTPKHQFEAIGYLWENAQNDKQIFHGNSPYKRVRVTHECLVRSDVRNVFLNWAPFMVFFMPQQNTKKNVFIEREIMLLLLLQKSISTIKRDI